MTIQPDQIKAARKLLGWSQAELAKRVHVAAGTIGAIESGQSQSTDQILTAVKRALEVAGVEITPWSVRLRDDRGGG
jgi:ribosome-binding protein aMBF1 (putative translation factor)